MNKIASINKFFALAEKPLSLAIAKTIRKVSPKDRLLSRYKNLIEFLKNNKKVVNKGLGTHNIKYSSVAPYLDESTIASLEAVAKLNGVRLEDFALKGVLKNFDQPLLKGDLKNGFGFRRLDTVAAIFNGGDNLARSLTAKNKVYMAPSARPSRAYGMYPLTNPRSSSVDLVLSGDRIQTYLGSTKQLITSDLPLKAKARFSTPDKFERIQLAKELGINKDTPIDSIKRAEAVMETANTPTLRFTPGDYKFFRKRIRQQFPKISDTTLDKLVGNAVKEAKQYKLEPNLNVMTDLNTLANHGLVTGARNRAKDLRSFILRTTNLDGNNGVGLLFSRRGSSSGLDTEAINSILRSL